LKKFIGLSLVTIMLLAIVLAISGCTSPTPTAAPTETPTAIPNATVTPAPTVVPANAHTAVIDGKTFNFTTLEAGKLEVATDASYAPFENVNTTSNTIEGFDIELMDQICKELNLTPVYTNQLFDGIILAVQTKKFDCSISAFTINAERQKSIDFSDPYYENKGQAIATKPGSAIKNVSDLVGHKVAVQAGTVGQDAVANITNMTASDIKTYQTMPDVMLALKKGEVDAAAGDYAVMYPYVKNYPGDYAFAPSFLSEVEYFGIVINKDNKDLTAAINAALAKIKADGRYQTIYDKWFA
jgi:polar amino acid transport system substrate-binding protein